MMTWFYFDYVKTNSGAYLIEVDEQVPLKGDDNQIVRVQSFGEAENYLVEQDIRGTVRDVIDEANSE